MQVALLKNLCVLAVQFGFVVTLLLLGCKKNSIDPEPELIDSRLFGVWFSSQDTSGYEVLRDGTMKFLMVDSNKKLQYAPVDTLGLSITLQILKAREGVMTVKVRALIPGFLDSTVTLFATFSFSNNDNTLTITGPDPMTDSITTIVYNRSAIGAVVLPKMAGSAFGRLR